MTAAGRTGWWRRGAWVAGAAAIVCAGCSSGGAGDPSGSRPPAVTAVTPSTGSTDGGTSVTVLGVGFTDATRVAFGRVGASRYHVDSDTQITAVSPTQAAGVSDISVSTSRGTSALVAADRFTYRVPAPTVTGVSPSSGPVQGDTTLAITGTHFTGATKVSFGATPALSFEVLSDTRIAALTPPLTGAHTVVVTTPAGASSKTAAAGRYTFKIVPTLTALSPSSGPIGGGTAVTISGSGLSRATRVLFGAVPASSFQVFSDTDITAVAPPQGAGPRVVRVLTPHGKTVSSPGADQFTYVAPVPVVSDVAPSAGPTAGGTTVTVGGTGFTRATKVTFGTVPASSFKVLSDTQITAVTPAQGSGRRYVYVTTPGGRSAPSPGADQFAYG